MTGSDYDTLGSGGNSVFQANNERDVDESIIMH